ncbi:MAG: DUF1232 domain-containing protein [Gemmatimonadetes bacterium]|nr:DUF1232 domain-containing protein [Gemmatimonadota bacterium]
MPDRFDAVALLEEWVESEALRKHMYGVEAAVRHYARLMGEDEELWALAGLLHDLDWERHPDEHPHVGVARLRELGYPEEVVHAIEAHVYPDRTDIVPESTLDRVLYACDELSGLVYACCLVRPNGIDDLKPKSVAKKLKDKAFARGVHRDAVQRGIELIGLPRAKHIQNVIDGMRAVADVLEVRGEDQARRRGEKPVPVAGARDYGAEYSDESFWTKLKELAAKVGRGGVKGGKKILSMALVLYYCLMDSDTPGWAKSVIVGALGYLIFPVDAVPDFLPVGLVDDLGVLAAAVAMVLVHIKPEHRRAAEEKLKEWFGAEESVSAE